MRRVEKNIYHDPTTGRYQVRTWAEGETQQTYTATLQEARAFLRLSERLKQREEDAAKRTEIRIRQETKESRHRREREDRAIERTAYAFREQWINAWSMTEERFVRNIARLCLLEGVVEVARVQHPRKLARAVRRLIGDLASGDAGPVGRFNSLRTKDAPNGSLLLFVVEHGDMSSLWGLAQYFVTERPTLEMEQSEDEIRQHEAELIDRFKSEVRDWPEGEWIFRSEAA